VQGLPLGPREKVARKLRENSALAELLEAFSFKAAN
jgi:hypothetical protein